MSPTVIILGSTAVVVVASGFEIPNEVDYIDIGAHILEHHVNQLTEESSEINAVHHPIYQL